MMKLSLLTWIRFTVWIAIGKRKSELMQKILGPLKDFSIFLQKYIFLPNLIDGQIDLLLHSLLMQLSIRTNTGRLCYLRK